MSQSAQLTGSGDRMKITSDLLRTWNACTEGYAYFLSHWPDGADYGVIQQQLRADAKAEWSTWLTNAAFSHALKDPGAIAALGTAEVKDALAATKDSPNTSSGCDSKAASRGPDSTAA